jgi:hypothetical protein
VTKWHMTHDKIGFNRCGWQGFSSGERVLVTKSATWQNRTWQNRRVTVLPLYLPFTWIHPHRRR